MSQVIISTACHPTGVTHTHAVFKHITHSYVHTYPHWKIYVTPPPCFCHRLLLCFLQWWRIKAVVVQPGVPAPQLQEFRGNRAGLWHVHTQRNKLTHWSGLLCTLGSWNLQRSNLKVRFSSSVMFWIEISFFFLNH